MRLLLDTHVAVWALTKPRLLSQAGRDLISDPENDIYVSVASIWEIAIKHTLGRVSAPDLSGADAVRIFAESGFELVNVAAVHAVKVETLALLHMDPFDRLIVAQALTEPFRLLTHDRKVAEYHEDILRV